MRFSGAKRTIVLPTVERKHRANDAHRVHANRGSCVPKVRCDLSQTAWAVYYHLRQRTHLRDSQQLVRIVAMMPIKSFL